MKEEFEQRFAELVIEGKRLIASLPRDELGPMYWVQEERIPEYQKWLGSTTNLLKLIDQPNGTFVTECDRLKSCVKNGTFLLKS